MAVRVRLTNLKKRIKSLHSFEDYLVIGAEFLRGKIIEAWTNAKGPSGRKLKALKPDYAQYKSEKLKRKPIRDLNITGTLYNAFKIIRRETKKVTLGFENTELKKAEANYDRDNNMLRLNKKIKNDVQKEVSEHFRKGNK